MKVFFNSCTEAEVSRWYFYHVHYQVFSPCLFCFCVSTFLCCRPDVFFPRAAHTVLPSACCSWGACFYTYWATLLSGIMSVITPTTVRYKSFHLPVCCDTLLTKEIPLKREHNRPCLDFIYNWFTTSSLYNPWFYLLVFKQIFNFRIALRLQRSWESNTEFA